MRSRLALLVLVAAGAVAGYGRGAALDTVPPPGKIHGNATLAEARAFRGFPLYFPGKAVIGHPLVAIIRQDLTTPARFTQWVFLYGNCPPGADSCDAPIYVYLWPDCYRYRLRYEIPRSERVTVRGVPGRLRGRRIRQDIPRLELYAKRTTIVIQGRGARLKTDLLQPANRLYGLNGSLRATQELPARPPYVRGGKRCA